MLFFDFSRLTYAFKNKDDLFAFLEQLKQSNISYGHIPNRNWDILDYMNWFSVFKIEVKYYHIGALAIPLYPYGYCHIELVDIMNVFFK